MVVCHPAVTLACQLVKSPNVFMLSGRALEHRYCTQLGENRHSAISTVDRGILDAANVPTSGGIRNAMARVNGERNEHAEIDEEEGEKRVREERMPTVL